MPPPTWNTAAYWRELAAHTRRLVEEVKDEPTRAMVFSSCTCRKISLKVMAGTLKRPEVRAIN